MCLDIWETLIKVRVRKMFSIRNIQRSWGLYSRSGLVSFNILETLINVGCRKVFPIRNTQWLWGLYSRSGCVCVNI